MLATWMMPVEAWSTRPRWTDTATPSAAVIQTKGGAAMLVFSSASLFVRQCAGLDIRPSSRHYGSLYVNGQAWPTLLQGAQDMDPQRPNGEVSDAHWRHNTQPCDANDVQGGAEREGKGKAHFSSTTTHGAC